jgi:hypothetical protein
MANRLLRASATIAQGVTDTLVESFSPAGGQSYAIQEIWTGGNPDVEVSATYDERNVLQSTPSDHLPQAGDGLVFDLSVQSGKELSILASEMAGVEQDVNVYILVDER